jgi:Trk-type K+ transport system membrane component
VAAPLLADVRRLVFAVIKLSLFFEAIGATILAVRWWTGYDYSLGRSIYLGIFHAITSFNNAGFALWTDNLTPFAADPWICVTVALLIIAGGLASCLAELAPLARPQLELHTS